MNRPVKIDLRSDTVTLPCDRMKQSMLEAELGDDVIDVDPTVAKLEKAVAQVLGKEAAIFMPSGTMTNQIAIRLHCRQGDELLCEEGCHIYNYEQAGFAQLTGVVARPIAGRDFKLTLEDLQGKIRPVNEHMARSRLVCIENTHNRGGGSILAHEEVTRITQWAHQNGLATHLDGARLFNAVVATGISAQTWSDGFDTVSICFSKGLGAPVGSALAGTEEQIRQARRHRKLLGGGMRQAGILAAAALFALQNNVDRLAEDHQQAQTIASAIESTPGIELAQSSIDTNIVIFDVSTTGLSASEFVNRLEQAGIRTLPFSETHVRVVTHLHISADDAQVAGEEISKIARLATA